MYEEMAIVFQDGCFWVLIKCIIPFDVGLLGEQQTVQFPVTKQLLPLKSWNIIKLETGVWRMIFSFGTIGRGKMKGLQETMRWIKSSTDVYRFGHIFLIYS